MGVAACSGLTVRRPVREDWDRVMAVMPDWWAGRDLRGMLPRIFFEHFCDTSFVVERGDDLLAFLVGFVCPDHADEAYIHFVGVHPSLRRTGLARDLYGRFFALAREEGRSVVRAVTAPVNRGSIAFHTALGFAILPGDGEVDGLPVTAERGPQGDSVVRFELRLEETRR